MSIIWLIPAALWGLAALAVPILVHLLTRQERRSIPFPSLRFLTATRLVALRHRRIHDWPLLLVRAAIVATAVAALAGPLLITPQRERAWNARTARAIVTDAAAPADEIQSAFASHVIPAHPRMADAVQSAVEWLSTQPPAARELLIAGDLRVGALDEADLMAVPAHVGIRFLPDTAATPELQVTMPVMTLRGDGAAVDERRVHLSAGETIVERRANAAPAADVRRHRLEVRAAAADQPAADAALAALLTEGIVADARDARHVIAQWPDADEPSSPDPQASKPSSPPASKPRSLQAFEPPGLHPSTPPGLQAFPWMRTTLERLDMDGEADGDTLIVRLPGQWEGARAVAALRRIASAAFDDPTLPREPQRIAAADLARWSRAPGVAPDPVRQEEGDRRVLWALALALLGVEAMLRRTKARARTTEVPMEESRVA